MNIEQEIWHDFKSLSESDIADRLSYSAANAHFGVVYEDRNSLIHKGISKKLEYDEDFRINQFLLGSNYKNVNWDELNKLYPHYEKIVLPSDKKDKYYPTPKFRTHSERRDIGKILLHDWAAKKDKLHIKIPNELVAKDYLINIRWGDKPYCPRCDSGKIYNITSLKNVQFKCAKCGLNFSEKVGTIFQGSRLELLKWYEAMYLLTSLKTSKLSTHQLAQAINVTQKTSWIMVSKIRSKVNDEFINTLKQKLFQP